MIIRIKDLKLRTIIGINDWEREQQQEVIVNAEIEFDGTAAAKSDKIEDTINYKTITKEMIELIEGSSFFLLEKLCDELLGIIRKDSKVFRAKVQVDKPQALRFTDSVSVESSFERNP